MKRNIETYVCKYLEAIKITNNMPHLNVLKYGFYYAWIGAQLVAFAIRMELGNSNSNASTYKYYLRKF